MSSEALSFIVFVGGMLGLMGIGMNMALALAAPFTSIAQDIKPRLIRFGYGLNEQSNQGRAAKVFAEQVQKASGGKMKLRAIGAAALGPDTQMQQALIGGAQEMMVGSTATLVGITKEMALWDTPFLISNAREADALLDGPIGEKIKAKLQDKGLVGLVYWENGFRNLTNSKRPVVKMVDLKAKGMQVNELSPAEATRMRNQLTRVYASIGAEVGMDLWNEAQGELARIRARK